MAIDPHTLRNWPIPVIEQTYTERDTILYALGLGLGSDPLDERQLHYVYEGDLQGHLKVLPSMAVVLGYPGFWIARFPDRGRLAPGPARRAGLRDFPAAAAEGLGGGAIARDRPVR